MANILLLDDSEIAGQAMRGILSHGHHRCAVAAEAEAAWKLLRELVKIDLVIMELRLREGTGGLRFLERLRADCFLKHLPVVVYTKDEDHAAARQALALKIQNVLIKPYNEDLVNAEIQKACLYPWPNRHFEEEKSFCAQLGLRREDLHKMLSDLRDQLERDRLFLAGCVEGKKRQEALACIALLSETAQNAGFWGAVDLLQELQANLEAGDWTLAKLSVEALKYGSQLIYCRLHPNYLPEGFLTEQEQAEHSEESERLSWMAADVRKNGPVRRPEQIWPALDKLPAMPVAETVAAGFLMVADGRTSSLNPLMDVVARDAGLTAAVLIAANRLERETPNPIEDPRLAITMLGAVKLSALAKTLPTFAERHLHLPPLSWDQFWRFLLGVARLAQFTCQYLEFHDLQANAYTAGLIHDLGKLLLVKLYPFGFEAMLNHARREALPLHEAERQFLGCTIRDLAVYFAQRHGLPPAYGHVLQWVETPDAATEDAELVAVVSLARDVCLHNHVGYCGDTPKDYCPPIEETRAWSVLRDRVFPSFDLRKFESAAQTFCAEMRQELSGKQ